MAAAVSLPLNLFKMVKVYRLIPVYELQLMDKILRQQKCLSQFLNLKLNSQPWCRSLLINRIEPAHCLIHSQLFTKSLGGPGGILDGIDGTEYQVSSALVETGWDIPYSFDTAIKSSHCNFTYGCFVPRPTDRTQRSRPDGGHVLSNIYSIVHTRQVNIQ